MSPKMGLRRSFKVLHYGPKIIFHPKINQKGENVWVIELYGVAVIG
jgi:hypothetical protein